MKKEILERETEILEFISALIQKKFSWYFQAKLTHDLLHEVANREYQILDAYEKEVAKFVHENTRFHSYCLKNMQSNPWSPGANTLSTVFNNVAVHLDYRNHCMEFEKFTIYQLITYREFEEAGFSKDFVKRVVKKFEDLDLLRTKKLMGGIGYCLLDMSKIFQDLKFSREAVEMTQFEHERRTGMDWVFEGFSDEELEKRFKKVALDWKEKQVKL